MSRSTLNLTGSPDLGGRSAQPGRRRLSLIAMFVAAATILAISLGAAERSEAARAACPATFRVVHNDRIGKLSLPAGNYRITLLDSTGPLTCSGTTPLFARFLQDFDGVLPSPWVVQVKKSQFRQRGNPSVGFKVTRVGGGGGGGRYPAGGRKSCNGLFDVLRNDQIGRLRVPRGKYRITVLSPTRISCARASALLDQFLNDFDGRLPAPWKLKASSGTFLRGSSGVGFYFERAYGPDPKPNSGGRSSDYCPGTFSVQHNDKIGPLVFPKGAYRIELSQKRGITCKQASTYFSQFLNFPNGKLPSPWIINRNSGTFSRGKGGKGFRVKPTS